MSPIEPTKVRTVVPLRHHGRTFAAVVVACLTAALLFSIFTNKNINWNTVWHGLWKKGIIRGVGVTIALTVISMLAGVFLGTLSAVAGLSKNYVLRTISVLTTWFFRGTPLLVQIIFWYNLALLFPRLGIPWVQTWDTNQLIKPFTAAALALSLNEGAYMSEIVRAGIQSVDGGQTEASQSLGLSPVQTLRKVVLPQAMRLIIPPTGNETISMLKSTALVSVIAASDLFTQAGRIYRVTYEVIDYLIVASLWYLLMTTVLTIGQYFIEKRFGRGFDNKAIRKTKINVRQRITGVAP
jgi:polar amino acid transport system permease protein